MSATGSEISLRPSIALPSYICARFPHRRQGHGIIISQNRTKKHGATPLRATPYFHNFRLSALDSELSIYLHKSQRPHGRPPCTAPWPEPRRTIPHFASLPASGRNRKVRRAATGICGIFHVQSTIRRKQLSCGVTGQSRPSPVKHSHRLAVPLRPSVRRLSFLNGSSALRSFFPLCSARKKIKGNTAPAFL